MKLREKFIKRLKDVRGRAVGFRIDQVRLPNGKKATREYLNHPGAVAAVAIAGRDKIIMVKQFRYPVGTATWEIPAGKIDRGENPLRCVRRELQEETGHTAKTITPLISLWPTAAFANEIIHVYVAEGLTKGHQNLDEDEFLGCETWPLKKILTWIKNGKIKDSKTIIAILSYQAFYR